MRVPWTPLRLGSVAVLLALAAACERQAPSPWKEMSLPLRRAEILPGADAEQLKLVFRGESRREDLNREFRRGLERAGYQYERDGKGHDESGGFFSTIFIKGRDRVRLNVWGGKDTNVQLSTSLED